MPRQRVISNKLSWLQKYTAFLARPIDIPCREEPGFIALSSLATERMEIAWNLFHEDLATSTDSQRRLQKFMYDVSCGIEPCRSVELVHDALRSLQGEDRDIARTWLSGHWHDCPKRLENLLWRLQFTIPTIAGAMVFHRIGLYGSR